VAVLAAGLYLFRVPLLRALGGALVVDEPPQAADAVLLLDGERREERAAELYHQGVAARLLVIEGAPTRLTKLGILPSGATLARRRLGARAVPAEALSVLPSDARDRWGQARRLRDWLEEHPGARVLVLCDRFTSREVRHVFNAVLGPDLGARLHWRGLPKRRYDETDWWRDKEGVLDLFNAYAALGYVCLHGEDTVGRHDWDPDAYEATLPHEGS
jgi:hypothetical protein